MTTVRTKFSEWTFDEDAKTYTRKGRVTDAAHPNVAYQDGPRDYTFAIIPDGPGPLWVEHPDGTTLSSWAVAE